jgi:hypothetical protein
MAKLKFCEFKPGMKIRLLGEPLPSFRVVSREEADRMAESKPVCPICEAMRQHEERTNEHAE